MGPRAALLMTLAWTAACGSEVPAPPGSPSEPPAITRITPRVGSTEGGTPVTIAVSGLPIAPTGRVTIAGVTTVVHPSSNGIFLNTPAHAAGPVDVRVEISGQVATLAGGFSYAPPDTFDLNGEWSGYGYDSAANDVSIVIRFQDRIVTRLACGSHGEALPPVPVNPDGRFSFAGGDVIVSGQIVAPDIATGRIDSAACGDRYWSVHRAAGVGRIR